MLRMYCDLCGKPLDSDKSRNFKIKELKVSWHESWWQQIDAHVECVEKLFDSVKKNLLKEQEAVKPRKKDDGNPQPCTSWWYVCGDCGQEIEYHDRYCRWCGRAVQWDG